MQIFPNKCLFFGKLHKKLHHFVHFGYSADSYHCAHVIAQLATSKLVLEEHYHVVAPLVEHQNVLVGSTCVVVVMSQNWCLLATF